MINENAQYAARPELINSDIEKAKKFLDNEFSKYDTMSDLPSHLKLISDGMRQEDFKRLKKGGVGRTQNISDYQWEAQINNHILY